MAVEVASVSAGNTATLPAGTRTLHHVVPSAPDRLLLVAGIWGSTSGQAITSVTYRGRPLTRLRQIAGNRTLDIWYMQHPPEGSADVVITWNDTVVASYVAVTLSGADAVDPFGEAAESFAATAGPGLTVTAAAGDLVVDFVGFASTTTDGTTWTADAGQTERAAEITDRCAGVTNARLLLSTEPGAASVSMGWTLSASQSVAYTVLGISASAGPTFQAARPDADLADGSWLIQGGVAGDLSAQTADENDLTFMTSSLPSPSPALLGLGDVTDPASSLGYRLRWRAALNIRGRAIAVTPAVYQGAVLIATLPTRSVDVIAAEGHYEFIDYLSAAEADAITDHTDLRIEWTASDA